MSNDNLPEAAFAIGDVVRHRASLERAVVVEVQTYCVRHNTARALGISMECLQSPHECERKATGLYLVSCGFGGKLIYCPAGRLELVPASSENPENPRIPASLDT